MRHVELFEAYNKSKNYVMIHFKDKKPIKKNYDTCMKAFYDYEDDGCTYVELFNSLGTKISSYPKKKE